MHISLKKSIHSIPRILKRKTQKIKMRIQASDWCPCDEYLSQESASSGGSIFGGRSSIHRPSRINMGVRFRSDRNDGNGTANTIDDNNNSISNISISNTTTTTMPFGTTPQSCHNRLPGLINSPLLPNPNTPRTYVLFDFGPRDTPLPSPEEFVDRVQDMFAHRRLEVSNDPRTLDGQRKRFRIDVPGVFGSEEAVIVEAEVRFGMLVERNVRSGLVFVSTIVY